MRKVAVFTHPACMLHHPGDGHPESPDRLRAVIAALEHPDFSALLHEPAPLATVEQLELVHPPAYVKAILALQPKPGGIISLDSDTHASEGSVTAARHAAGGVIAAIDAVMEGWADCAFAAVRPPGHHAEPGRAMGFCFFSNVAIAAQYARRHWGLRRVAVVDFDVHHGNGTQAVFEADSGLFYVSSHQSPCYPGTGLATETGVSQNIVNMPLPPGTGSAAFREAWKTRGLPALRGFKPELVIVSAGFDGHRNDPLAQMNLETADFGWLTERLLAIAPPGRLVSALEGGYDLPALAASVARHMRTLLAIPPPVGEQARALRQA